MAESKFTKKKIAVKKYIKRFITNLPQYYNGKPIVLKLGFVVLKLAFRQQAVIQLSKEIRNTKMATKNGFSDVVVRQKPFSKHIAVSKLYKKSNSLALRFSKMIDFSIRHFESLEYTRTKARIVLKNYMQNILTDVSRNHNYEYLKKISRKINSPFFDFKIPQNFMHGDFNHNNAIVNGGKLYLIDWEYSSEEGSIIYDWWYLRRCIYAKKNEINERDFNKFNTFLENSLSQLEIDMDQFNASGAAMNVIVGLVELEIRQSNTRMMNHRLNQIDLLINNQN